MARSTKPKIHIDDLHLADDGSTQAFHASWQEAGLIVELTLDIVALDHWQHGQYRARAYELTEHMRTVSGRPMGAIQEDTAFMLLRELRGRMRAAMLDAGWREVATTREGQPIYLYRPAPWLSDEVRGEGATAFVTQIDQADDLEDQAGQHPSKIYEVYGAHSKEHGPAYTRRVTARTFTFNCAICGASVTRECYPGQLPRYCGSEACQREAVRLRVEKHRANKSPQE